jgi:hypothetical protein
MRIVFTNTGAAVLAHWLGAERVVFTGSIWDCLAFVREG